MKINWKIRFRNRTWLAAFLALIVTFAYDLLSMMDIVPTVTEDLVMGVVNAVLTMLVALGVIVDPTTQGANDSERAMSYKEPGGQ